jgi:ribosomal protein S27AE
MASDSHVYPISRTGSIDVDNPKHIAELRGSSMARALDLVIEVGGGPQRTQTQSKECPQCLFQAWSFTRECPRCGVIL